MPSQASARRALGAGMAELQADLRVRCCACTKSTMRFHAARLLVAVQARAAGRDARVGRTRRSFRSSRAPAPPIARAPRCTRWIVARAGRPRREYCAIGDTTTRFFSSTLAQRERREHRRDGALRAGARPACASARREPALEAGQIGGSRTRRFSCEMRWRAREQRVGELLRLQYARSARTFSNHSVELRAAFWMLAAPRRCARRVVRASARGRRSSRYARRCCAPVRSRLRAPAWCRSRSRSARCARRRPSARPALRAVRVVASAPMRRRRRAGS